MTVLGIIGRAGSKIVYIFLAFEVGFSLFDSFAIVNAFIAWRNSFSKASLKVTKNCKNQLIPKYEVTVKFFENILQVYLLFLVSFDFRFEMHA